MAIGLTRSKNLSERNLNLKTALQKLYAPGIENDIALFSLSSSVESVVVSGLLSAPESQIVGVQSESLSLITGEIQPRTKFLTEFFTFTDLNEVAFSKFTLLTPGTLGSVLPKTSQNGELYALDIISGGRGFYFELPSGGVLTNSTGVTITGNTVPITTTYNNLPIRGSLYFPTSGVSGTQFDVVVLYHPTIDAFGVTPINAAENFLNIALNQINLKDKIIFSVAYPQDAIPAWNANPSLPGQQFPGIDYPNFYFGDNITYAEAALLWVKEGGLNAFFASNNVPRSIDKIFTFGHSQGGYLTHRLNTMHSVDGVISNAPGPIDLLARCTFSESTGEGNNTCEKIKLGLGSALSDPSIYDNLSLKNFLSGTLSSSLFTQALDDTTGDNFGAPQVQNMQNIIEPGLNACTNCANAEFKYYNSGGHDAFVRNSTLQRDIRIFVGSSIQFDEFINVENVSVRGTLSGRETARAKITFIKHLTDDLEPAELTKFTPDNFDRYSIFSIEITSPGSGYIFPEPLELVEGNIRLSSDDSVLVLKKQKGKYFSGQPELLRSKTYIYQVRGADRSGFFLYDNQLNKYVFLGRNTGELGFTQQEKDSIELRRFDGISINNFLQFKFAQSRIWLDGEGANSGFRIQGGSISGEINRVASVTNNLQLRTQAAIQNTRRPTPPTSSENVLGYKYNSFDGEDVVIWQRVVLRDPDFVLNPNNPDFNSGSITGSRLRSFVENFELQALNSPQKIKVPGLFIKVGAQYFRAFSTTDKPFFAETSSGEILNPKLSSEVDQYALSAESLAPGSNSVLYSYDTVISQLAQRINSGGVNGALYYHRVAAPLRRTVETSRNDGSSVNVFAVPLFSLV
jgi:hypothetical protein